MTASRLTSTEILRDLVAFDTTSHKSNTTLIDYIVASLDQHGVRSALVPTADGSKASLFATIGPDETPGIALSGHTDVVPVTGQAWDSDPFELRQENGRLYGRGTCDMKGFLASVLAAVPDFCSRSLTTPIHLAFSYDEETGCTGVRPMLSQFGDGLVKPALAIVGEPSVMSVVDAHKGPVRWQVAVTGRAAHSSMAPLGVNAVMAAAALIGELSRMEDELKVSSRDERFTPPFSTLQVTEIEGGTASNIVPQNCIFGFEVRALPGFNAGDVKDRLDRFARAQLLPSMRDVADDSAIDIEVTNEVPPFASGASNPAVALALRLSGCNETHAVSYATEAGLFQAAGVPSVICGPGDIAQAHTANEWLAVEQLAASDAFMVRLAEWAEENRLSGV
jgi:acetylornithine deacetylase